MDHQFIRIPETHLPTGLVVPPGWFKVAVKIKPTQETAPCHA